MSLRAIRFAGQGLARSAGSADALALRGYARKLLGSWPGGVPSDTLLRQAEADLRAALDAHPEDARSWATLGALQREGGRYTEAAAALHRAYDADAFLSDIQDVVAQLFFVSLNLTDFAAAERWCTLGQHRFVDDPRFTACKVIYLGWAGQRAEDVGVSWRALGGIERADSIGLFASQWGFLRVMVAATAARAGLGDSARAILVRVRAGLAADSTRSDFPDGEAYVSLLLGDRAGAKAILSETIRHDPSARARFRRSPWFATLASDAFLADEAGAPPAAGATYR
jgi:tetratricopeptide (TPR) repeat protein